MPQQLAKGALWSALSVRSVSIKLTFPESSQHYLSIDVSFASFRGGQNFSIVFSDDVIITS